MSGAHLPVLSLVGVSPVQELNQSICIPVITATGERIGLHATKDIWRQLQKQLNGALAPRCVRVQGGRQPILKPYHSTL